MFFFIAGIQPRTVKLDEQPGICTSCGLNQAQMKRVDHYFSVFFLPVFRVKKGSAFLECQNCKSVSEESDQKWIAPSKNRSFECSRCGMTLERTYRFCPHCGRSV